MSLFHLRIVASALKLILDLSSSSHTLCLLTLAKLALKCCFSVDMDFSYAVSLKQCTETFSRC